MSLANRFADWIRTKNFFVPGEPLLVALSGGLDSVALAECCRRAGHPLVLVHCNFRLRGAESERDEEFVRKLGEDWNVPVLVRRFDTAAWAEANGLSVQEAARQLRYDWFEEILDRIRFQGGDLSLAGEVESGYGFTDGSLPPARWLLTAHQQDDAVETLLMHFFRGTGLKGLTGIPERQGWVIRPFLPFTRDEILDWARAESLTWVEDSSNKEEKYTRNYIRHTLLPAVEKIYPQVRANLAANLQRFRDSEQLYRESVSRWKKKLLQPRGAEWHIPVQLLLQQQNRSLVFEIIREFGFGEKQIDDILNLARGTSGSYLLSPRFQYRIIRHRRWLIVAPVESAAAAHHIIESPEETGDPCWIETPAGFVRLRWAVQESEGVPETGNPSEALLDLGELRFPLLLRRWKPGDYFYPLGMGKKKKIARFLIDQKMSLTDKEKIWVLESAGRICWVVGLRIDDRFRCTPQTQTRLRLWSESQ